MCGRFVTTISPELLVKIFGLQGLPDFEPRFNVAPSQHVWVVRSVGDHNRLDLMKWGLIPSWSKDTAIAAHTINARCETVAEKPAFRHAIKKQRCIVPAAGFYEWQHSKGHKQPYYVRMVNSGLMAFAGLWEKWKSEDDEDFLETFTILTTSANELITPIHTRMPVILYPEDYDLWLDTTMHDPEQLQRLYQPFPPDLLTAHKVPDLVNNPRFDSPACIAQV